jgi:hypothetical protein
MERTLEELTSALRKTIDQATNSVAFAGSDSGGDKRALRRALALLWSAHDELAALRGPGDPGRW